MASSGTLRLKGIASDRNGSMGNGGTAPKLKSAAIEAANRGEATSLLIRCGYRVYRPEADIAGEDLVIRTPEGVLHGVQLKSRAIVDQKKYGGLGLLMLFPGDRFVPDKPRPWFLIPHDLLFPWVKDRHGSATGCDPSATSFAKSFLSDGWTRSS